MSKHYEKVKGYYDKNLWSKTRVYNAVGKWITAAEYEEITGETYEEPAKKSVEEDTTMMQEENHETDGELWL